MFAPPCHPFLAAADFRLADPAWLLAALALPLALWLRGRRGVSALVVPFSSAWRRAGSAAAFAWPPLLAGAGLVLLAAALARPQYAELRHDQHRRGYDIMLAIDLSGSMRTEDYERNGQALDRLQAIKPVIQAFVDKRPDDRIGVVVFATQAYTLSPLTFDHAWLARQISRLKIGVVDPNHTAIGDALGVALTRLNQGGQAAAHRRQGAFIVLLTDGANNYGVLTPQQGVAIAKSRGIPIYTIGAGRSGLVPIPVLDAQGNKLGVQYYPSDLDEGALRDIADATGGHYYRAADSGTIKSAFESIDRAQKLPFDGASYEVTTELFPWFAAPGLVLLALAALLARPFRRKEALA